MNYLAPVIALTAARRLGDSNADAAKATLMSLIVQPPMAGLMTGLVMAANAAKANVATAPLSLPPAPFSVAAALTARSDVTSITNDGKQSATITVQALNANQQSMPGVSIDFSADMRGAINPASATTDANGLCIAVLTAGTDVTARTINVVAANGSVSATPIAIQVVASNATTSGSGGVAATSLTAKSDVTRITDDGKQLATITVQALDASQKPLSGVQIDFSADMGGIVKPAASSTDANGLCVAVLGAGPKTTAQTISVTAANGAVSATPIAIQVISTGGAGAPGSGDGGGGTGSGPSGGPSSGGANPDLDALVAKLAASLEVIFERLDEIDEGVERIKEKVNAHMGRSLLAQVAPSGPPHREVPSFLWKSKEQARSIARQLGLPEPTFILRGDVVQGVVLAQQPKPGSTWSEEDEDVSLELG